MSQDFTDDRPPTTPAWRRYLGFWGPRVARDVDDELRFHLDMRMHEYISRGMSPDQARHALLARVGDLTSARDECLTIGERRTRRMTRVDLVDALRQDVRFALRTLGRQKGWTAVAVLTLTLGIGATTAVCSVISSLLLHPIAYPDANRVVLLYEVPSSGNNTGVNIRVGIPFDVLHAWRTTAHSLERVEEVRSNDMTLRLPSLLPIIAHEASVTTSFPAFAGAQALVGRIFTDADASTGHVAMLGEGMWRTQFGADPHIVGRPITLDDSIYTIIGVLPASLSTPSVGQPPTDVWLPIDLTRHGGDALAVARVRRGVSHEVVRAELDSIIARVAAADGAKTKYRAVVASPGMEHTTLRDALLLLLGAVGLVLVIACANVAHLLLARTMGRQRELSVRAALGAGRGRLFRQLLTESAVLAVSGCACGVTLGWLALRVLVALRPATLPELGVAHLDATALMVVVGLSASVALLFGVIGSRQSRRHSAADALRTGAASSSSRDSRFRSVLVLTEMTLSTMLLVGAGLLVRSVVHLQTLNVGFDTRGLYALGISLPASFDTTGAEHQAFYRQLLARLHGVPGVEGTTSVNAPPSWMYFQIGALQVDDQPAPADGASSFLDDNDVAVDYFQTMRIPFREGSAFTDTSAAAAQVIVNEGLASRYWPGRSAVGHRIRIVYQGKGSWRRIVGVVGNTLSGSRAMDGATPMLYFPLDSTDDPHVVVRLAAGRENAMPVIRRLLATMNPRMPAAQIVNVDDAMASTIALPRFTMTLLTAFTGLAVALAAIGLYGVLAYGVARRRREIGIRVALGAPGSRIARLVIAQSIGFAVVGGVIGLLAAYRLARLIGSMLYGVTANDPWSFAVGGCGLVLIAILASAIPLRRALRIDPLIAIRAD